MLPVGSAPSLVPVGSCPPLPTARAVSQKRLPAIARSSAAPLVAMVAALGLRCGASLERLHCGRQRSPPQLLTLDM